HVPAQWDGLGAFEYDLLERETRGVAGEPGADLLNKLVVAVDHRPTVYTGETFQGRREPLHRLPERSGRVAGWRILSRGIGADLEEDNPGRVPHEPVAVLPQPGAGGHDAVVIIVPGVDDTTGGAVGRLGAELTNGNAAFIRTAVLNGRWLLGKSRKNW